MALYRLHSRIRIRLCSRYKAIAIWHVPRLRRAQWRSETTSTFTRMTPTTQTVEVCAICWPALTSYSMLTRRCITVAERSICWWGHTTKIGVIVRSSMSSTLRETSARVTIDSRLTMADQVAATCRSEYFQLTHAVLKGVISTDLEWPWVT